MSEIKTIVDNKGLIGKQISGNAEMILKVPLVLSGGNTNFTDKNLINVGTINGIDITTISGSAIPANIKVVAKSGGQYTTINAGLTASLSGDVVVVYPGTYEESFSIPSGVRLVGYPAAQNIIIAGSDDTSTRVVMNETSTLREVTVKGPVSGDNPAIDMSGLSASELGVLFNVVLIGSGGNGPGILGCGSGSGGLLTVYHNGGVFGGDFVEITGGSVVIDTLIPNAGRCDAILKVSGSTSKVTGQDIVFGPLYGGAQKAIEVGTSGTLQCNSILIPEITEPVTSALYISGDDTEIDLVGGYLHGSVNDFFAEDTVTNGNLSLNGVDLRLEKVVAPSAFLQNASIIGTRLDKGVKNDKTYNVFGEFSVGYPGGPAESAFGSGDSNILGAKIFGSSSAGGFTDKTNALTTAGSATTASIFDEVTSGTLLYIGTTGSFSRTFENIKLDIESVGSTGSGFVSFEYVSGTNQIWKEIDFLVTDADSPYTQRDVRMFDSASPTHIRFNTGEFSNWVTSSVNGETGYWMRMKVSSSITTSPTLSRIKIGQSRTEINSDGYVEFFGNAEPERTIPGINLASVQDLAGASPANASVDVSANINLTANDNSFANNTTDGFGQLLSLPNGVDTSRDITYRVTWHGTSDTAGDVNFSLYYTEQINRGDNINAGTVSEVLVPVTASVGTNQSDLLQVTDFVIRLPRQDDRRLWAYSLSRDGSADTYNGNVVISSVGAFAHWWHA